MKHYTKRNVKLFVRLTACVPADKAPSKCIVLCKSHYTDCLIKELGIDNSLVNPPYTPTALKKEEILDNHKSVLCSFGISTRWQTESTVSHCTGILKKCPFKQRYIAVSSKYSPKSLTKLLTSILSAAKTGLQSYCDTSYSRTDVNQVGLLKILQYIQPRSLFY